MISRVVCLIMMLIGLSCAKPYRVAPSSHHITHFTEKAQFSSQLGYRNIHAAMSITKDLAVKGSVFSRFLEGNRSYENFLAKKKVLTTGGNEDNEIGFAYYTSKYGQASLSRTVCWNGIWKN